MEENRDFIFPDDPQQPALAPSSGRPPFSVRVEWFLRSKGLTITESNRLKLGCAGCVGMLIGCLFVPIWEVCLAVICFAIAIYIGMCKRPASTLVVLGLISIGMAVIGYFAIGPTWGLAILLLGGSAALADGVLPSKELSQVIKYPVGNGASPPRPTEEQPPADFFPQGVDANPATQSRVYSLSDLELLPPSTATSAAEKVGKQSRLILDWFKAQKPVAKIIIVGGVALLLVVLVSQAFKVQNPFSRPVVTGIPPLNMPFHTWRSSDGRSTIDAQFLSITDDRKANILDADGNRYEVPLTELSKDDQAWATEQDDKLESHVIERSAISKVGDFYEVSPPETIDGRQSPARDWHDKKGSSIHARYANGDKHDYYRFVTTDHKCYIICPLSLSTKDNEWLIKYTDDNLKYTGSTTETYPVLSPAEWNKVIQEAIDANKIDANKLFLTGVVKTSTKYLDMSTNALEKGDGKEGRRCWMIGHLLGCYGAQLAFDLCLRGIPETDRLYAPAIKARNSLLENRKAAVETGNLTIEVLEQNIETMNSQLELLGRPKFRSLSKQ